MNFYVDAIYDQGILRPLEPLALPDQSRVKLHIESETARDRPAATDDRAEPLAGANTLFDRLRNVIGSVDDLPEDSSTNLDHYLYGAPKR